MSFFHGPSDANFATGQQPSTPFSMHIPNFGGLEQSSYSVRSTATGVQSARRSPVRVQVGGEYSKPVYSMVTERVINTESTGAMLSQRSGLSQSAENSGAQVPLYGTGGRIATGALVGGGAEGGSGANRGVALDDSMLLGPSASVTNAYGMQEGYSVGRDGFAANSGPFPPCGAGLSLIQRPVDPSPCGPCSSVQQFPVAPPPCPQPQSENRPTTVVERTAVDVHVVEDRQSQSGWLHNKMVSLQNELRHSSNKESNQRERIAVLEGKLRQWTERENKIKTLEEKVLKLQSQLFDAERHLVAAEGHRSKGYDVEVATQLQQQLVDAEAKAAKRARDLEEELRTMRQELIDTQSTNKSLSNEKNSLQGRLASLEMELKETNDSLCTTRTQSDDMRLRLQAELANLKVSMGALETQRDMLLRDVSSWESRYTRVEDSRLSSEQQLSQIIKDRDEARNELRVLEIKFRGLSDQLQGSDMHFTQMQSAVELERTKFQDQALTLQTRLTKLEHDFERTQKELSLAETKLRDANDQLDVSNQRAILAQSNWEAERLRTREEEYGLKSRIAALETEREQARQEVALLETRLKGADAQLSDAMQQQSQLEKERDEAKNDSRLLEIKNRGLTDQLQGEEQRSKQMQGAFEAERARLQEHSLNLQSRLSKLEYELDRSHKELQMTEGRLRDANEHLALAMQRTNQGQADWETERLRTRDEVATLQSRLSNSESDLEHARQQGATWESRWKEIEGQLTATMQRYAQVEKERDEAVTQVTALEIRIKGLTDQFQDEEGHHKEQHSAFDGERAKFTQQITDLRAHIQKLEGDLEHAQKDLVLTEGKLKEATASAASAGKHATEGQAEWEAERTRLLEEVSALRTKLTSSENEREKSQTQILTWETSHKETELRLQEVAKARTEAEKQRDDALYEVQVLKIQLNALQGADQSMAQLQSAFDIERGTLKEQISSLQSQLTNLRTDLNQAKAAAESSEQKVRELTQQLAAANQRADKVSVELGDAQQRLEDLQKRVHQETSVSSTQLVTLEQERDQACQQVTALQARLHELEIKLSNALSHEDEVDSQRNDAIVELRRTELKLQSITDQLNTTQQRLIEVQTTWDEDRVKSREEISSLRSQLSKAEHDAREVKYQLHDTTERLKEANDKLTSVTQRMAQLQSTFDGERVQAAEKVFTLQSRVTTLENDLERAQKEVQAMEGRLREAKEQYITATQRGGQAQADLQAQQLHLHEEITTLQSRLLVVESERDSGRQQITAWETRWKETDALLKSAVDRQVEIQSSLDAERTKLLQQVDDFRSRFSMLEFELERARKDLQISEGKLRDANEQLTAWTQGRTEVHSQWEAERIRLRNELSTLQTQLTNAEHERALAQQQSTTWETRWKEVDVLLKNSTQRQSEIQSTLDADRSKLQQQVHELQSRFSMLEHELDRTRKELQTSESKLRDANDQLSAWTQGRTEVHVSWETERRELRDELSILQARFTALENERDAARQQSATWEARWRETDVLLKSSANRQNEVQASLDAERTTLQQQLFELQSRFSTLEFDFNRTRQELQISEGRLRDANEQLTAWTQGNTKFHAEWETERHKLRNELSVFQTKLATLESERDKAMQQSVIWENRWREADGRLAIALQQQSQLETRIRTMEIETFNLRTRLETKMEVHSQTNVKETYKVKTFEMAAKLAVMDGTDDGLFNGLPIEVEGEGLYRDLVAAGRRPTVSPTVSISRSETYKVTSFEMAERLSKMDGSDTGMYNGLPIEIVGHGLYSNLMHSQKRRPSIGGMSESTTITSTTTVGGVVTEQTKVVSGSTGTIGVTGGAFTGGAASSSFPDGESYLVDSVAIAAKLSQMNPADDGTYKGMPIEVKGLGLYRDLRGAY